MAMATKTTKADRTRAEGAKALEYLQHAIEDIDRARGHGDKKLRSDLDTAMARIREITGEFRTRAEHEAADWQETPDDRARAGDSIEVNGLPGRGSRRGQIVEVLGGIGHEHYDVRWDEQHTSIFFPTEGTTVIRHPRSGRTTDERGDGDARHE